MRRSHSCDSPPSEWAISNSTPKLNGSSCNSRSASFDAAWLYLCRDERDYQQVNGLVVQGVAVEAAPQSYFGRRANPRAQQSVPVEIGRRPGTR